MKNIICCLAFLFAMALPFQAAEPVAKQFLRYVYGVSGIELTNICHPSPDSWMMRGNTNANALRAIDELEIFSTTNGVVSGVIQTDLYFLEVRDGKVDPAFFLEGIYTIHRQLVLNFIYAGLSHDQNMLKRLVTDPKNVKIEGPKAPGGEMGHYTSIIEAIPVVRVSTPSDDAKSKTVTYRAPLGDSALSITLVKVNGTWKIDSTKTIRLPLEFFFR